MTRAPLVPPRAPGVPLLCPEGTRAPVPPCLPIGHGARGTPHPTSNRAPVPRQNP